MLERTRTIPSLLISVATPVSLIERRLRDALMRAGSNETMTMPRHTPSSSNILLLMFTASVPVRAPTRGWLMKMSGASGAMSALTCSRSRRSMLPVPQTRCDGKAVGVGKCDEEGVFLPLAKGDKRLLQPGDVEWGWRCRRCAPSQ